MKNPISGKSFQKELKEWEIFYENILGEKYNFKDIMIPQKPNSDYMLLIIMDIPIENLYLLSKKIFKKCWRWTERNLDEIVNVNGRDKNNCPYAIWVFNFREGEMSDTSEKTGVTTETLTERLIHGLFYFKKTRKHLDRKTFTLCADSRYSDGGIPSVGWRKDVWCLGYSPAGKLFNNQRFRRVFV